MLKKPFPAPCRVDYVPSPYEPDEDGVIDVGYRIGKLSDNRPYRLECWRMDDMLMVTIMFCDIGLSAYKREDMHLLLEVEELVRFVGEKRPLQCALTEDDLGRGVWALNLLLQNRKGKNAELCVELNSYK